MRILYCIIGLFIISGCASSPTNQIAAFGESINAITEKVDAVFDEYNDTAVSRDITSYAATYKGEFTQHFNREELAKIAAPISPKQKSQLAVYRANKTLGRYAQALTALASAGSRVDVDLASADLYGALMSFNQQYQTIKNNESPLFEAKKLASISTVIAQIGSVMAEEKRRAAIKKIVLIVNQNIGIICDEIVRQLRSAKMEQSIAMSRQYILDEQIIEYKALAKKSSSKLKWRTQEMLRLYQLQQQVFNSKLIVQRSIKAIVTVKEAHNILAKELENDRFTSATLSQTIGRLKALDSHYDDFEQMLLTCENVSKTDLGVLSCDE